jgi:hypothetical protein
MHLCRVKVSPMSVLDDRVACLPLVDNGTVLGSMVCEAAKLIRELKKPVRSKD